MVRLVDKSFKWWRLFVSIQIVDIFVRKHEHGNVWPIFGLDTLTKIGWVGISVTLPVMKLTVGVRYSL